MTQAIKKPIFTCQQFWIIIPVGNRQVKQERSHDSKNRSENGNNGFLMSALQTDDLKAVALHTFGSFYSPNEQSTCRKLIQQFNYETVKKAKGRQTERPTDRQSAES